MIQFKMLKFGMEYEHPKVNPIWAENLVINENEAQLPISLMSPKWLVGYEVQNL